MLSNRSPRWKLIKCKSSRIIIKLLEQTGDDDDYFDDFDGDDGDEGGLFRRRIISGELFDMFVDAVLSEWQKTMMNLPAGFRLAYDMGLVSSAQMVRFLAIDARLTATRFISRSLPHVLLRTFTGTVIADPAFLHKLLLEQISTISCSIWWDSRNQKESIKHKWDLALINVLTVSACSLSSCSMVVLSLVPCSYENTFQSDMQITLQNLPDNIFGKSYPFREIDFQKRLQSFFYKTAQLCMVGFTDGIVQGAISNIIADKKEGILSVTIPPVSSNALGYGAVLGLYANLRYQLLNDLFAAQIFYMCLEGTDIFFLKAYICQLGMDQRKVNVLAREYCDDIKKKNKHRYGMRASSDRFYCQVFLIFVGKFIKETEVLNILAQVGLMQYMFETPYIMVSNVVLDGGRAWSKYVQYCDRSVIVRFLEQWEDEIAMNNQFPDIETCGQVSSEGGSNVTSLNISTALSRKRRVPPSTFLLIKEKHNSMQRNIIWLNRMHQLRTQLKSVIKSAVQFPFFIHQTFAISFPAFPLYFLFYVFFLLCLWVQ